MKRRELLTASLAALAAGPAIAAAQTTPVETRLLTRNTGSLVLPGGGARGAYEAGVIEGIRERAGVRDGEPLPGVDAVVGTSIGAINGWFVATAQYSKLREVWETVGEQQIFQIKKPYRATIDSSSGLLTRVFQAALVSLGLTTTVRGLIDAAPVRKWLDRYVDPTHPLIVPLLFTLTNLERQRSEIFTRFPFAVSPEGRANGNRRVQSVFGDRAVVRTFSDAQLTAALAGSSAIPIVLDPVELEFDGHRSSYIDGGIADSAPLDIARLLSRRVKLILVDPAVPVERPYPSAAEIGIVAFTIAQNRVLDASLRSAYLETQGKRLFDRAHMSAEQRTYFDNVFDVEIEMIRPRQELRVSVAGFDDVPGINEAYELGRGAGSAGFAPYDPGAQFGQG